jgi:hypothetical protein
MQHVSDRPILKLPGRGQCPHAMSVLSQNVQQVDSPGGSGSPRNTQLVGDDRLVKVALGEFSWLLVSLESVCPGGVSVVWRT